MNDKKIDFSFKFIVLFFLVVVVIPFLPLLISWRWNWWEAWVFAILNISGFAISRALASRRHPDLLVERSRFLEQRDAKPWDKLLSPIVSIGGGLIPLAAGLDELLGWSPAFNMTIKIISLLVILAGYMLASCALIENRYFSGMVRIQTERSHRVISSGPYGWMRHPGYAGAILSYLAFPFLLDSLWSLIPAVLITITLIIRTNLEDKTLQAELDGYREYANRVRHRLLPGIW